jgi:hypothetical protein
MKRINIKQPFTLTDGGGQQHRFTPGIAAVEDWIAGHWYARAHSEPVSQSADSGAGAKPIDEMTVAEIKALLDESPNHWRAVADAEAARDKPRDGVTVAVEEAKAKTQVKTEG